MAFISVAVEYIKLPLLYPHYTKFSLLSFSNSTSPISELAEYLFRIMRQLFGRNFVHLLTVTFRLIEGTMAASVLTEVTKRDLQPRLIHTPPPDPACYPGYNSVPAQWDPSDFQPVIRDFQALIEDNPQIYMGFTQMFEQIPNTTRYLNDPNGFPQVLDYPHALYRLNRSLEWSPMFGDTDLFTVHITALLFWASCTEAGYRMFADDQVNQLFQRHLNVWAEFLSGPQSLCALANITGGWFSPPALEAFEEAGGKAFQDLYKSNSSDPHFGFESWDGFFTREFQNITLDRPIDSPGNNNILTAPCEATPYNITHNVQELDSFWIKEERYSIRHMLFDDPLTSQFIGGTVYQSYLSTLDYHRWHSPVSGNISKIVKVPGTYYAISTAFAFSPDDPDPDPAQGGNWSQKYMSNVATRMLIFIDADNTRVGTMVFIAIGMGEVSSCEATVQEGQHVDRGDQLGMFHVGGSSFAMAFKKGTSIKFVMDPIPPNAPRVKLNARIGTIS